MIDQLLVKELTVRKINHTAENIIAITKTSDGRIYFLEKGDKTAGLAHILQQHGSEFEGKGILPEQIPALIMTAITKGTVVDTQSSRKRPVYEVTFNGRKRRLAIEIGNNGFIVSANPKSSKGLE
ncbi:MAG: hypothetical protein AAGJ69_06360 [Cyanobacteria bacterium J06559_1]